MRQLSESDKFVVVTPYFGGISSAPRQTELSNVTRYFVETYKNLKPLSSQFIVSVSNDTDYETIKDLGFDIEILYVKDIDPIFLPANTARIIQKRDFQERFVYYTEADQLLYAKDIYGLLDVLEVDRDAYIVPQRFCQIPNEVIDRRRSRYRDRNEDDDSRYVEFDGIDKEGDNKYCIECAPWALATEETTQINMGRKWIYATAPYDEERYDWFYNKYWNTAFNDRLYNNVINDEAYGGAYLCHMDLFKKVMFQDSDWQPTEHTAGHDLLATNNSVCLKTIDYYDFHIDHLSGYDFNKKLLRDDWNTAR
jgi:hypothetical protein